MLTLFPFLLRPYRTRRTERVVCFFSDSSSSFSPSLASTFSRAPPLLSLSYLPPCSSKQLPNALSSLACIAPPIFASFTIRVYRLRAPLPLLLFLLLHSLIPSNSSSLTARASSSSTSSVPTLCVHDIVFLTLRFFFASVFFLLCNPSVFVFFLSVFPFRLMANKAAVAFTASLNSPLCKQRATS